MGTIDITFRVNNNNKEEEQERPSKRAKLDGNKEEPLELIIYDWKRSKNIFMDNPYAQGFTPVEHLSDCNFNHYTLQLNTYKRILERNYNVRIVGMYIGVFHPDQQTYLTYTIPDESKTMDLLFQARKRNLTDQVVLHH